MFNKKNSLFLRAFLLFGMFAVPCSYGMSLPMTSNDKDNVASFKEKLTSTISKSLPTSVKTSLQTLAKKMAIISASKFASDTVNAYFGNTLQGYAISASAHLFLLVFIEMYEAWQNNNISTVTLLKKMLPIEAFSKSYWEKSKLLSIIQYGCTAINCIAPYIGISQAYPIGMSLFIQALLYDDAVKESLVANLYGILSSSSLSAFQAGINNLPEEVRSVLTSLSPDKAYSFLESLMNLIRTVE